MLPHTLKHTKIINLHTVPPGGEEVVEEEPLDVLDVVGVTPEPRRVLTHTAYVPE